MFLKRLEIIGFKSFAERIGIDFVPGVTAVVGPNGSGKSNITDAIRWVLGEQSAKSLRGSKMEDVIFAGSDSRKALNFAEVTLILDNSKGLFPLDYTEISVSRRVFRSGESVYLLNGQQCRLKDINDVFIDSGLGKEAFSIISQGRVDEILNSRPEDRRSIFDEAAGVLKYRTRKQKAEHKLFETSDNLDRVLDILKELDIRIEPLKERAEAAKRHAVLSHEVREADIMLLNFDAGQLRVNIESKLAEVEKFQAKKDSLLEEIERNEEVSSKYKEQLEVVEEALEKLQQQLVQVSAEAEKWEGRRLLSAEKEKNASYQIERIQGELKNNEQMVIALQGKLKIARENMTMLTKEYEEVSAKISEVNQILKRSVKETEIEIEELKTVYIDGLNEEATLRNELKHMEERLVGEKYSSEKTSQQTKSLRNKLEEQQGEKKKKDKAIKKLKKSMIEAKEQFNEGSKSLSETESTLRHQQELLQRAHNKQSEMQGRLRALQSMEADFSGFYSGVKEVLLGRKSGKLTGINGAIAELITVNNTYVKAVETALGAAMQHIVTETEKDARSAIGYLKAQNKGRATFLPLDVMRSRKIPASALRSVEQHPDFVGLADGLVEVESRYQMIAENLLGNVLVASTLAGAGAIAKILNYRYRIVTVDGDIVNAGGSLTGGGAQNRTSVFSRKAELETLQSQLQSMEKSIETASISIGDTKMQAATLMEQNEVLRTTVERLQTELTTAEVGMRETSFAISALESELATVEIGRRGAETTGTELLKKKNELKKTHDELQIKLETSRKKIEALERFAADWRSEEALLTNNLTNYRERAAVLRQQLTYKESEIVEMTESEVLTAKKIKSLQGELDYLNGDEDAEEQLTAEEIIRAIEKAIQRKEQLQQSIAENREKRTENLSQIETQAKVLRTYREQSEQVNLRHNEATIELSRLEVSYETMTQKLLTEYGLRPDFQLILDFDEEETRVRLLQLKQEIAEIGPVNPSAIQEYDEVSKRHEFLTSQRNDLLEAKNTLREAMSEMDQEMTMRFSTTFEAIQNRFRHVFQEMFGGGNADLVLTNPNNLLETGVEIVARPPGKKMQNLSLLSGGERALTAISLLFSIIEVRPVPFCILDEVEAALDEANVVRYSNYLKKFSDTTQFIVITHRKGTMEGADVLYGITMQESGVSKLISVKLSEVPEEVLMNS